MALLLFGCSTEISGETSGDSSAPFDAASREPAESSAPFDATSSEAPGTPGEGDATTDVAADTSTDVAGDSAIAPSACASLVMGPAGGTLVHPSGAQIVVPAGALAAATSLSLCTEPAPVAGLLGAAAVGAAFQAGPDGQTFLVPVDIVTPFDPTLLPTGSDLNAIQMRMGPSGATSFGALQSTVDSAAGLVHAQTTHFTQFVAAQSQTPIFITSPATLPQATVGVTYSQAFAASGGIPPYTWSLPSSTTLPPGLSLSTAGVLSGVPTVANDAAFFVKVSDAASDAVEMAVSLTIVPATNPGPTLSQVTPASVAQGTGETVISLAGTGFVPTSAAQWDGASLPTTFVGPTQLAASIPASDLTSAGSHAISVVNPAPGGGSSAAIPFAIVAGTSSGLDAAIDADSPLPSIASVTPMQLPISAVDVQLTITGSNFVPTSHGEMGAQSLATSYVSPTQLLAVIPAADLSTYTTWYIGVSTPPPGGGDSATTIAVTLAGPPIITGLSPAEAYIGIDLPLTISGIGFAGASLLQVLFDGSPMQPPTVRVVNTNTITTIVPANLVNHLGAASVTVGNQYGSVTAAYTIVALPEAGSD
jgi:hypothetical protein